MTQRVSVVLCAFNAASTIECAINSVLAQDYALHELILVDDGSADDSLVKINKYLDLSPLVKVFSHKNSGIGISRNKGISEASGEWIAFIDADDVWHPNKLSIQMGAVDALENLDAIVCDSFSFSNDGELCQFSAAKWDDLPKPILYESLGRQLLRQNFDFPPATVVWRAQFLKEIGGYGNDRNGEDFKPFLNLAGVGGHLFRIYRPLYAGRRTQNSLSRSSTNHYTGAMARLRAIEEFQNSSNRKLTRQYIEDAELAHGRTRFLRWALYGVRNGYPRSLRFKMSRPLIASLDSIWIQVLEFAKTVISIIIKR